MQTRRKRARLSSDDAVGVSGSHSNEMASHIEPDTVQEAELPPVPKKVAKAQTSSKTPVEYAIPESFRIHLTVMKPGPRKRVHKEEGLVIPLDTNFDALIALMDDKVAQGHHYIRELWSKPQRTICIGLKGRRPTPMHALLDESDWTFVLDGYHRQVKSKGPLFAMFVHYTYEAHVRPLASPLVSPEATQNEDENSDAAFHISQRLRTREIESRATSEDRQQSQIMQKILTRHKCDVCPLGRCIKVPFQTKHCQISHAGLVMWTSAIQNGMATPCTPPDDLREWKQYQKDVKASLVPRRTSSPETGWLIYSNHGFIDAALAARYATYRVPMYAPAPQGPMYPAYMESYESVAPTATSSPTFDDPDTLGFTQVRRWLDFLHRKHPTLVIDLDTLLAELRRQDIGYDLFKIWVNKAQDGNSPLLRYGFTTGYLFLLKGCLDEWKMYEKAIQRASRWSP